MSIDYREKCLSQKINVCYICGTAKSDLVVHHLDGDRSNNTLDNLVPMCRSCHSRLHSSKSVTGRLKELQDKLPDSTLCHTEGEFKPDKTVMVPVSKETRELIREEKDKYGMTYDGYLSRIVGQVDPVQEVE